MDGTRLSVFLILVITVGCATSGSTQQEQNQQITKFYSGQDIEEIQNVIWQLTENFFEVLEGGNYYQYIQSRHPQTRVLFGLYFENKKLNSLIVGQDVSDFHELRSSMSEEEHWLDSGFPPYREWLINRNRINSGFPETPIINEFPTATPPRLSRDHSGAEVIEAIGLFPIVVLGGIGYFTSKALGLDLEEDTQKEEPSSEEKLQNEIDKAIRKQIEILSNLYIGMREDRLVNLMDQIGRRIHMERSNVVTYRLPTFVSIYKYRPSFSFGFKDRKLTWIESCSMLTGSEPPHYIAPRIRVRTDCGSNEGISHNRYSSVSTSIN